MGRPELSPRQAEALAFVRARIAEGRPPTVREVARGMGVAGHHASDMILKILERKGYITREANVARSIRLAGGCVCPACGGTGRTDDGGDS